MTTHHAPPSSRPLPELGATIVWPIWDGTLTSATVIATPGGYNPAWTLRSPDGHAERFERLPSRWHVLVPAEIMGTPVTEFQRAALEREATGGRA